MLRHSTREQKGTPVDANDVLFGNSIPALALDKGDEVKGKIIGQTAVQRRELRLNRVTGKMEQGDPLYWKDGRPVTEVTDKPVMDPVLILQTTFRNWECVTGQTRKEGPDDGKRRVFVKGRKAPKSILSATLEACRSAGVGKGRKIQPGDYYLLRCTGEGQRANRGMNAPKEYEAQYWTADNPPVWAGECESSEPANVGGGSADADDNPFDI